MKPLYDTQQILEAIDVGVVILDAELRVRGWNRWLQARTGLREDEMLGRAITERFPNLKEPRSQRFLRGVLSFGTYAFFSQKLHGYLLAIPSEVESDALPFMQQSCTAGPIRGEDGAIVAMFITIHDVTEMVTYEHTLKERVRELNTALEKIRQLEGILPICVYCKQIRDDEASWQNVEEFVSRRTKAQFSHGICPSCADKLDAE